MNCALELTIKFAAEDDETARVRARALLEDVVASVENLARYGAIWAEVDEMVLSDDTFHKAYKQNRFINIGDVLQEMKDERKDQSADVSEEDREEED